VPPAALTSPSAGEAPAAAVPARAVSREATRAVCPVQGLVTADLSARESYAPRRQSSRV